MNNQRKPAGQSTREMSDRRYKARVWLIVLASAVVIVILLIAFNTRSLGIGGLGFLALVVLARLILDVVDRKARRMVKEERRAVRGAQAEEKIGAILDRLGDEYFVLHDVASAFGNIDHIVIAQAGGIFLIETKAHGGRVSVSNQRLLVNGREPEKDFIAQALQNTYWLRDTVQHATTLKPWISPVVVFTNAFVERAAPIKGVRIVNAKYLAAILSQSSPSTSNREIWAHRLQVTAALDHTDSLPN